MEIAPSVVGLLGFALIFVLLLLKVPVAFAFAISGFSGLLYLRGFKTALNVLVQSAWTYGTDYILMAVPLFVLMGQFSRFSDIGSDLYFSASKWFGSLPGGLAIATVWGSAGFGACTGSSTAGILTFAPIAYQPMRELKYDRRLILGALCCGGTLGLLIPPSLAFIIFGSLTEESVGKLFMAGFIPGIIEAAIYSVIILFLAKFDIWSGPAVSASTLKEKILSLRQVWGMLILIVLVLCGIYMGYFTPTEAGAVGAVGALFILTIRKGVDFASIRLALEECLRTSCMVFTIMIGSMIFTRFIALSGLSFRLIETVSSLSISPMALIVVILIIYFFLGAVMPSIPVIVLTVPMLYPIVVDTLGFSGIWFGVLVCAMVEIAFVTPPIGLNLFVMMGFLKGEAPDSEVYIGVLPFVVGDILRVILLLIFPQICLWLPSLMFA